MLILIVFLILPLKKGGINRNVRTQLSIFLFKKYVTTVTVRDDKRCGVS